MAAFVESSAIFEFLSQIYIDELRRPVEMPLDPVAVGTWGAFLFVNGLREDNKELVIGQIRQTPEYRSVHGAEAKPE